jgi:hypothetical protein
LVNNPSLEKVIGKTRMRCKHGPEESGGGDGGAAPQAKRAKLQDVTEMTYAELGKAIKKAGLPYRASTTDRMAIVEKHRCSDALKTCGWKGVVSEFPGHLAECGFEAVECPHAAAGCKASVLRKDAMDHASETCEYRQEDCQHCHTLFQANALPEHEGSCPEAPVECPNAGCGVTVASKDLALHRGGCEREVVDCPCPGYPQTLHTKPQTQHHKP